MSTATLPEQKTLSIVEKDPNEGLVSQYKYADMIGKSRVYINRLVHEGVITLFNGKIKPDVANQQILENTASSKNTSKKGKGVSGIRLNDVRIEKELLNKTLLEMDIQTKKGELVNRAKTKTALANKVLAVVGNLQKVAHSISTEVARESDPLKCHNIIWNELKDCVEDFNING